jgi:hypothetical protein
VLSTTDIQRLVVAVTDFVGTNERLLAAVPVRSTAAE